MSEVSAYHEAGHAFMAIYVGARVRSVTIEPDWDDDPERFADIQAEWPLDQFTDRELHEKSVLVALAVPVAGCRSEVAFRRTRGKNVSGLICISRRLLTMSMTKKDRILELLKEAGVLRPRDLEAVGISGVYLNKLYAEGLLERPARGLYILPDSEPSEHRTIAEAGKRVPQGVVCLLSALRFHDLTTQAPFEIWLAIDEKARLPKIDYPPLRIVRFSGQALSFGVEEHDVDGVKVRIYSAAKTVADCFKYRNKIGLDVAIEALRDCVRQRKATVDELWAAAKVCRMTNVIRPYLEAVT